MACSNVSVGVGSGLDGDAGVEKALVAWALGNGRRPLERSKRNFDPPPRVGPATGDEAMREEV